MADFHTMQSSYVGALALSYVDDGCMLRFSKVFKPISPKEIQKGMKIYDYQNSKYFKLDMKELTTISNILKRILSGRTFQDLQGKFGGVEVNGQGLKVSHFPQGGSSQFSIFVNSEGQRAGQLTLGFSSNINGNEFKMYLGVDNEDLGVFIKFLDTQAVFSAHLCAVDFITYASKKNNGGSGNYDNNSGGGNNQSNSYSQNYGNSGGNGGGNSGGNNYQNNNYGNSGGNNYKNNNNNNGGGNSGGYNNNQNNNGGGYGNTSYQDDGNLIG